MWLIFSNITLPLMPQKVTYKMIHTLYKVKNTIHTHRFERDTQSKGGMKYKM